MSTKTPQLDGRGGRRRRARELKHEGWKQQDIAAALGVMAGAASQWLKRRHEQGVEVLRRHPAPGQQPWLSDGHLAQIPTLMKHGAEAYSFLASRVPEAAGRSVVEPLHDEPAIVSVEH